RYRSGCSTPAHLRETVKAAHRTAPWAQRGRRTRVPRPRRLVFQLEPTPPCAERPAHDRARRVPDRRAAFGLPRERPAPPRMLRHREDRDRQRYRELDLESMARTSVGACAEALLVRLPAYQRTWWRDSLQASPVIAL